MKRFVYSPKVWAYVKIGPKDTDIIDISDYIISGNVNRVLNAASTARVDIRNPNKRWTGQRGRWDRSDGPTFRPMDLITIWMMRIPGYPVQVFTGYLDSTPYAQLYPGAVTLNATCTLKRLFKVYYDGGLPYMQSFLAQHGWTMAANGTYLNPAAVTSRLSEGDVMTDGGFGKLLFGSLKHIGQWKPNEIAIEPLPEKLMEGLSKTALKMNRTAETAGEEYKTFLTRLLGAGSYGVGGGGGSTGELVDHDGDVAETVYKTGVAKGADDKLMLSAFMTGIVESGMRNLDFGDADSYGWRQERASLYGGKEECMNVPRSALRYFDEGLRIQAKQVEGDANTGYYLESWTAGNLAQAIQGSALPDEYDQVRPQAQQLLDETRKRVDGELRDAADNEEEERDTNRDPRMAQSEGPRDAADTLIGRDESSAREGNSSTSSSKLTSPIANLDPVAGVGALPGQKWGAPREGNPGGHKGVDANAAFGTPLHAICDGTITYAGSWGNEGMLVLLKPSVPIDNYPNDIRMGFAHMSKLSVSKGDKVAANTILGESGAGTNGQAHLHFFVRQDDSPENGTMDPTPLLKAAAAGQQPTGGPGSGAGGDPAAGTPADAASAFTAQFILPGAQDQASSFLLRGEKSLMNDVPLFDLVQQLTKASLREFQSLPDGRFFAFYPDYFGETNRGDYPYWEIDDVELLDGTINLSDEGVITHQYVVGDTILTQNIGLPEQIFSSGVVTLASAFLARHRINDEDSQLDEALIPKMRNEGEAREAALKYYARYGVNPSLVTEARIRSPYFEFFLAYQLFLKAWVGQFKSDFTFTFMPELFPGGKLGFKEHGIKMYIESVTHSFDYSGGFTTSAMLSAPSSYDSHSGEKETLRVNLLDF